MQVIQAAIYPCERIYVLHVWPIFDPDVLPSVLVIFRSSFLKKLQLHSLRKNMQAFLIGRRVQLFRDTLCIL